MAFASDIPIGEQSTASRFESVLGADLCNKNLNRIITALILVVVISGCKVTPDAAHSIGSSDLSSTLSIVDQGTALYANNCVSCHGAISQSTKIGATSDRINIALGNTAAPGQASMAFLKSSLTLSQVDAISAALIAQGNPNPTPTGSPSGSLASTNIVPTLGSRLFLQSALNNAFIDSSGDATTNTFINSTTTALISNQVAPFGGPCSRYDGDCPGGKNADGVPLAGHLLSVQSSPKSNTIRSGFIYRACEQITENNAAVRQALKNAGGLTENSAANSQNINLVFMLFNRGGSVGASAESAVQAIYDYSVSKGLSNIDAWRFVVLAICAGPEVGSL